MWDPFKTSILSVSIVDAREAWVQTPVKRVSNLAILTILPI